MLQNKQSKGAQAEHGKTSEANEAMQSIQSKAKQAVSNAVKHTRAYKCSTQKSTQKHVNNKKTHNIHKIAAVYAHRQIVCMLRAHYAHLAFIWNARCQRAYCAHINMCMSCSHAHTYTRTRFMASLYKRIATMSQLSSCWPLNV